MRIHPLHMWAISQYRQYRPSIESRRIVLTTHHIVPPLLYNFDVKFRTCYKIHEVNENWLCQTVEVLISPSLAAVWIFPVRKFFLFLVLRV